MLLVQKDRVAVIHAVLGPRAMASKLPVSGRHHPCARPGLEKRCHGGTWERWKGGGSNPWSWWCVWSCCCRHIRGHWSTKGYGGRIITDHREKERKIVSRKANCELASCALLLWIIFLSLRARSPPLSSTVNKWQYLTLFTLETAGPFAMDRHLSAFLFFLYFAHVESESDEVCYMGCNGNGYCSCDGICICLKGFTGPDCSLRNPKFYTLLCSTKYQI